MRAARRIVITFGSLLTEAAFSSLRTRLGLARRRLARRLLVELAWPEPEDRDRWCRLAPERRMLLRQEGISVVIDVGAHRGEYAASLRSDGYSGRIVSFEPLAAPFAALEAAACTDRGWVGHNIALGDMDGELELNVAGNSFSSSVLPMTALHVESAPTSAYVGRERARVRRLDDIATNVLTKDDRAFLKIDVQGAELAVLRGSERMLAEVRGIECELSLAALYEGQPLATEVVTFLAERGFVLIALGLEHVHPCTRQILQLNGLFASHG